MTERLPRAIAQLFVTRTASSRLSFSALCLLVAFACGGKADANADAKPAADAVTNGDAKADPKDTTASGAKDAAASDTKADGGGASKASVAASVAVVKTESFTESVEASGVVSARTGHFAALSAPGPTRITAVNVTLGAHVKRGEKLIAFETTVFDAAVSSADAALKAAQENQARARRLVDAGVSPRKDAEAAMAEVAAAQAASTTAHRAQQLGVLVSPIDGVVTRLNAVLGASVDAGQALVEIADTRALDVQLVLSPALATKVHAGQAVTFRDGSAADAAEVATGKVADVAAALDSSTRGVIVRVSVGSQRRTLRIGESLYGRITAFTHAAALVIPDAALVPTGEGFQVFVVDDAGKAHATPVKIGARDEHRVWVTDGLKAGQTIVTAGAFGMDDGATVVTKKSLQP
jgi:RND family efflux transporter MFP subunit